MSKVMGNSSFIIMLAFPFLMGMIVGVTAATMAGPAIIPSSPTKNCDSKASELMSTSTTSSTWFGIPTQRRYISTSSNVIDTLRGGGGDDATSTIYTPSSVADLDALLIKAGNEQQLVVIDFTASWCGPCQTIAPKFQDMSETISNVIFVKIDVDESPDVAAKYNVSAMPTFIFIKGGEIIDRLMGANVERLQEMITELK